ncbi:hypothetical protein M3P05_19570 [Sansalvadorimonas sp. 2012CJ34-2]|uniref:Uncharacterized protein n=1 Tax=Parendozoicomonas callyspongiae TaxID=2942213 RepID=A0ABT0PLA0_9GAMM|nr:hypothetical protein [Sansalvadorimonas sp. 2012CJ34-2]MCL6272123.1 hypothetical protein [Sansalvadorimonas sp. 2012CJ34-2]
MSVSISRLQGSLPLESEALLSANEDLLEKLDAFRVRYGDLQDSLGGKVFRSLLLTEDEEPVNMADTLNRMEKRGILGSADFWRKLREIRNAFAHDYPEAEEDRANAINLAWKTASDLLDVAEKIHAYCEKQGIQLQELNRADK